MTLIESVMFLQMERDFGPTACRRLLRAACCYSCCSCCSCCSCTLPAATAAAVAAVAAVARACCDPVWLPTSVTTSWQKTIGKAKISPTFLPGPPACACLLLRVAVAADHLLAAGCPLPAAMAFAVATVAAAAASPTMGRPHRGSIVQAVQPIHVHSGILAFRSPIVLWQGGVGIYPRADLAMRWRPALLHKGRRGH